jgi:crotonobetainyl-CoA:carnitine CoA-transferase CaiB-like acyl-CoA transferase
MTKPLDGVRILDLTRLIPGGVCTLLLAQLGADVVKIEDPNGGDYVRWTPPQAGEYSVYFHMSNRGKRSAIIDLKHEAGKNAFLKLVAQADALVEGFRPDVMTRLGCDYRTLQPINPKLVYCSLSGWGADGPYRLRSGHDLNYAAVAGLHGAQPTPQVFGGQTADIGGAYMAVAGILAGLMRCWRTGEGGCVDVSLFEAALPFGLYAWAEAASTGQAGPGGLTGGAACYNLYRTRDGRAVSLAALEPKFWENFCQAIHRLDLVADYLLPERQKYLYTELTEIFALKTAAEWDALLKDVDCCFALVNAPGAVSHDPQVVARGALGLDAGGAPWLRSPIRLDNESFQPGAAPGYGAHTRAVLCEAGYSDADVDELSAVGAIQEYMP